jgi:hypothetical protein
VTFLREWLGILILLVVLLGLILTVLFYSIEAIILNSEVPTLTNWVYKGEGNVEGGWKQDCYHFDQFEDYKIGNTSIGNNNLSEVWTPVKTWNGYKKAHLTNLQSYRLFYKVYERQFWFDKQYLLICK